MWNGRDQVTDGINAGTQERQQRGLEIAALARIQRKDDCYLVPSVTNPRPTTYKVKMDGLFPKCNCPDHEIRGCKCKHIYAVEYYVKREHHADGSTTVTESVTVTKTRKTYPQNWPAYNAAQQNEKHEFAALLSDLCKGIADPAD